jgi:hypothetical protein
MKTMGPECLPATPSPVPSSVGTALEPRVRSFLERQLGAQPGRVQSYRAAAPIERTPGDAEAGAELAARAAVGGGAGTAPGWRQDFSGVRVHSDTAAADKARAHGAAAYAIGNHLVFGRDRYRPDTERGLHLLAHELTHLLQQGGAQRQSVDRFEARGHESIERVGLTAGGAMTDEEASAVYFGNWMRDMNQVFVPALSEFLPAEVVFPLISYMAAMRFGRELTPEQFGFYIPAEHLDNPAGLVGADDLAPGQPQVPTDARPSFPDRLGAPRPAALDTPQEDVDPGTARVQGAPLFAVDRTGVMAYLRRSNLHVERRLELAAAAGRTPDGMQHFGAALHAIEDLFAHSNYVEIAVDRLLRTDPNFLGGLRGAADRQVFTYSQRVSVPGGAAQGVTQRPVLTTGTFTGADTAISISSEVTGLLSRPLPEPATNAEQLAQDRMMVALLRTFEARLRANPALRQLVRTAAANAGLPGPLANRVDEIPLATIYQATTILRIPIPDQIRIPLKRSIRHIVSQEVLQPVAARVQAAGLEARAADTSLITVLRESGRQERGGFTSRETAEMRERERLTGRSVAQQQSAIRAASGRRSQAIRNTPLHVVAGPSHSQIAKDHPNSPFFGIAFTLAQLAVTRLRDRMLAAWNERHGAPAGAFDFSWGRFPAAAPPGAPAAQADTYEQARRMFHESRPARGRAAGESLQRGRDIVAQGRSPGQPYDLAAMRLAAANRIRAVVAALRGLAGAPDAAARAATLAQGLAGQVDSATGSDLTAQMAQARSAALAAGASPVVVDINAVANSLAQAADSVQAARRHDQREQANATLMAQRQLVLTALAQRASAPVTAGAALLYVLDQEIQATTVAYRREQREVLEGRQALPEMGGGGLGSAPTVAAVPLPPLTGSAATVALMSEARMLLGHPYDNTWWEAPVRQFAAAHADQLVNDIEARNEGVPFYRGTPP